MKDCISRRRDLETALTALKLPAPVNEPILTATRAFPAMLAIKYELETSLVVRKIMF